MLLSVGYSACHWCHVMAHESFEDPAVAAVMNELFVNIKVDREERPDLDQIYQAAHALLSRRSGGWPLTMFLTPDGEPFYGGTYFPKHGRYGLPGFIDLLPRIAAAYREQGDAIAEQSARLIEALASIEPQPGTEAGAAADALPGTAPAQALAGLLRSFDPEHGGFGTAPKFPHPTELEFCLREHALTRRRARRCTSSAHTLSRMADGGIHDQLGGGFCRYSVDAEWTHSAFREDALRQRAAARALRRPRAHHRRRRMGRRSRAASSAGSRARCARRTARSTRASTPTAKARRASSTSGRPTRCARCCRPTSTRSSRRTSVSTDRRTSKAMRGICA